MTDAEFLQWIHIRLLHQHGENCDVDFMIRLREIIKKMEAEELREYPRIKELEEEIFNLKNENNIQWLKLIAIKKMGLFNKLFGRWSA